MRGSVVIAIALLVAGSGSAATPGRRVRPGSLVVGFEYALLDNPRLIEGMAAAFAETGVTGMKHYVEAVQWGNMQKREGAAIDFTKLDGFVGRYQAHGFTELTLSLKSHSRWASKSVGALVSRNATPKPRFVRLYADWVRAVVERYDGDGVDDLEGLRWPVRYYEIGNELSSYEPEPIGEYLGMLEVAYRTAHEAFPGVRIAHAAFLTAPVNLDVDDPGDYDEVWRTTKRHDEHHGLADLRAVLDRPELFDVLNLHNLGDPYEIEDQVRWLDWETSRRGYGKPIIISDTLPTSYVGWGAATRCEGAGLGLLSRPATEADRCALAAYFTRLVADDPTTVAWTRDFVAADHVQRTVIAAEQGIRILNLAFVADIPFLKWKSFNAGAGISAWGGAIDIAAVTGVVRERLPLFHAVRQLVAHLADYDSIRRIAVDDPKVRLYEIRRGDDVHWIAWLNPGRVVLPARPGPTKRIAIPISIEALRVERLATTGTPEPSTVVRAGSDGLRVEVGHAPVFLLPAR